MYIHYTHRHKPESESDSKIAASCGAWQLAGLAKTKCLNKWPATSGYINSQHCRRRQSARLATNASIHRHTYKQTYYVYICVYACLLTVCVCVCTICLCQLSSIFFSFFLSRFCNVSTTQHKQRGGGEERRRRRRTETDHSFCSIYHSSCAVHKSVVFLARWQTVHNN